MSFWKLKIVLGTFLTAAIFTAVLYAIAHYMLGMETLTLEAVVAFTAIFMFMQYIISPFLIEAYYGVEFETSDARYVQKLVEEVCSEAGVRKVPKAGVAYVNFPNAFAYGNFLTGGRIVVTKPMLSMLGRNELKAVIAHELGHLRHKDIVVMLAIALIPQIVYFLAHMVRFRAILGARRREDIAYAIMMYVALMALYFVLGLGVLWVSRLREYYADAHAVELGYGSALKSALLKISRGLGFARGEVERLKFGEYLMISPVEYYSDLTECKTSLVRKLFSTHPPLCERLKFIDKLMQELRTL